MPDRSTMERPPVTDTAVADVPTPTPLEQEAATLHRALFGQPIPAGLARHFVRAVEVRLGDELDATPVLMGAILRERLDIEAIEMAARRRNRDNLLTKKLHILCYLCEAEVTHQAFYVQRRDRFWKASFRLAFILLRSLYKFVKGTYLIWRYRVV